MRVTPIVRIITYINILVFLMWFGCVYVKGGPEFMMANFLVSWESLIDGRWWTLVTSAFSHNMILHIFINMFVLRGFGTIMSIEMGVKKFVIFYLLAGISGALTHSLVSNFWMNQPELPALGASGAIAGIILYFSLVFPEEKILLLGIIPVRAMWGAVILVGVDVWGLLEQTRGGGTLIGHGAHLGGAAIGILWFLVTAATKKRQF
ncbi:MAG: rhomboid family intramembrane serine protease [Bacteriovoracaceae bacterium]